jgi:RND family efflux transporter MFP subunit
MTRAGTFALPAPVPVPSSVLARVPIPASFLALVLGFLAAPLAWAKAPGAIPTAAPPTITVATLGEVLVDLERRAPAEVRPLNDSQLAAEVSAVVRSVHAEVGQRVAAGDLLVALDDADYRLALARSEAELASARARRQEAVAKLERARTLTRDQYVSADELLERETALAVADASISGAEVSLAVAERNLERCRVLAPFAGAVADRQAQVGAFVNPGSPLLRLTQTDRYELDAEIPAAQIESLLSADSMEFHSRGERWPLRLLRASPVIATERRARRARFEFTGESPEVGRSGEVVWRVASGQLPAGLVSRRGGRLGVFLLEEGRAVFRVLPGAQEGRPATVDLPLRAEVILQGRERLQDGDVVTVDRDRS